MLVYPTLDVFSYDIRESLGQSEAEIKENRQRFKNRLPTELWDTIDQFDTLGQQKIELLGKGNIHSFEDVIYEGYYYPVRLNDSYGLLLDCSCREPQSSDNLEWVSGLKQAVEQRSAQKPTLGQTWVFYASVSDVPLENYDVIAQKCYQTLFPNADWYQDATGSSEFNDGKLFELEQEQGEHVLILLFSNEQVAKNSMPKLIWDELHWFWYRHKITWAYGQSRRLKDILKSHSVETVNLSHDFSKWSENRENTDISEILQRANSLFRSYLELLNGLAAQIQTIETNLLNYRKLMERLAHDFPGFNISNEFEHRTTEKYLRQIQRDKETFTLQLDFIKNIVASIQAQGVQDNLQKMRDGVEQIGEVQRKVEWLEVFFASYYAAALTHYISSDFGFTRGNYGARSVIGWAIIAIILTLAGLRPWEHPHGKKQWEWWWIFGIIFALIVWFLLGYSYSIDVETKPH